MSFLVTISCDGHRHAQPCRGAFHGRDMDAADTERAARDAGWRIAVDGAGELCPSPGHDEDDPR